MSLWSERGKADQMRKFSNGASPVAAGRARKKFPSGMRFFENAAGGMRQAKSLLSRRKKQVSAIVPIFKRGWTCMMQRKEERQLSCEGDTKSFAELARRNCNNAHVAGRVAN